MSGMAPDRALGCGAGLPDTLAALVEKDRADHAIRSEISRVAALWQIAMADLAFCDKPDCAADPCLWCQALAAEGALKAAIVAQGGEARP